MIGHYNCRFGPGEFPLYIPNINIFIFKAIIHT